MKLLVAVLFSVAVAFAQESVQIIRLKHRSAEELIPVLEGLYPGQVHVKTMNGRLFVRSSLEHFVEIKKLVDELDRKPKMLRISVATNASGVTNSRGIRVNERGLRVHDNEAQGQAKADRVVQTLEGTEAWISTGQPQASSGFFATPQLQGDGRVVLRLGQQEASGARIQNSRTTVSGRLGEWFEVGGVNESSHGKDSGLLSRQSVSGQTSTRVLIKVEESQ